MYIYIHININILHTYIYMYHMRHDSFKYDTTHSNGTRPSKHSMTIQMRHDSSCHVLPIPNSHFVVFPLARINLCFEVHTQKYILLYQSRACTRVLNVR